MTDSKDINSNNKTDYQPYLVCLIDILGQKDKLCKLHIPTDDGEQTRNLIIDQLKDTAGKVLYFRKTLDNGLVLLTEKYELPTYNLPLDIIKEIKEGFKTKIRYYSFSDTIVIHMPIDGIGDAATIYNIFRLLAAICLTVVSCHAREIPIRGGIEIGDGIIIGEGEYYGAGLEKAYTLEQNVADYPRILIGRSLIDFIQQLYNLNQNNEQNDFFKQYSLSINDLVTKDDDCLPILDYMSQIILYNIKTTTSEHKNIFKQCHDFANNQYVANYKSGDIKLASKYGRMLSYFERAKVIWTE